jgi:hypothetical protein
MTTTLPAAAPETTSAPSPAPAPTAAPIAGSAPAPARSSVPVACPVERRALATAARDLADALTGIAFDAPCCPSRQRAVVEFSAGVLRGVQAVATRTGHVTLHRACRAVELAAPVFAGGASAGAPALAGAWIAVADLLEGSSGASGHDHSAAGLLACERRFRAAGPASFVVPWFADGCTAGERVLLARNAPRRQRLALRLTEDRWLDRRAAVRGW